LNIVQEFKQQKNEFNSWPGKTSGQSGFYILLTMTARSLPDVAIVHSNLSPGLSWRNTAMPSGIVALSDFDFGRAIEIFDLRLMTY